MTIIFRLNLLLFLFLLLPKECMSIPSNRNLFEDKKILVIGGTGYLGRAIIEEVLKYSPKKVYVFSRDEVKHFTFLNDFSSYNNLESTIGDIRDYQCLLSSMRDIDIVFHVAALKRMDTMESNVFESIKTNILGSMNVFNACVANKVKKVIFVSTDKACSAINTYGASKFVSEKIFTNYDYSRISTMFSVVRFGNIIESTGSVIPIFTEKIKRGDVIPLTDPLMTRFIINKQEAVELIIDAVRYGVGGEIFVRKIAAMKIVDLIDTLKKAYNTNNQVKIIGIRPGEKIHEVLVNQSEMARAYEFGNRLVIVPNLKSWSEHFSGNNLPIYITRSKLVKVVDYNSQDALIDKEGLEKYLRDFWINMKGERYV